MIWNGASSVPLWGGESYAQVLKRPVSNDVPEGISFGWWSPDSPVYPSPNKTHQGKDYRALKATPCWFREPGTITFAGLAGELGLYCQMRSEDGLRWWGLGHLSRVDVQPGQQVAAGEPVALTGGVPGEYGAGLSDGPHLHEEVRVGWQWGERINPDSVLEDAMTAEQREQLEYVKAVLNAWAEGHQEQFDLWANKPYPIGDSHAERLAAELRGLVNILTEVLQ